MLQHGRKNIYHASKAVNEVEGVDIARSVVKFWILKSVSGWDGFICKCICGLEWRYMRGFPCWCCERKYNDRYPFL